jgi:hypothetical protein
MSDVERTDERGLIGEELRGGAVSPAAPNDVPDG